MFSAVTSAFLIESYTLLKPDSSDTTNILLARLLLQQQNVLGDAPATQSIDLVCIATSSCIFDPPVFAKRVNNLWFASLILSLATAAFAMLVKQWLREFFAGDYTSPRTRLRIHFYRYPGLTEWHVFELVALLPLLLLVSLGLFLAGLCFFTLAVDTGIGYTTTVLVACWGISFTMATISPIFSPRCPYKITFLKHPMKAIRRYLATRFQALSDHYIDHSQPQTGNIQTSQWLEAAPFEEEYFAINAEWNTDLDILLEVDAMQLDDRLFLDTIIPLVKEKENVLHVSSGRGAEDMIVNAIVQFIENRSSKSALQGPLKRKVEGLPRSLTLETWTTIVAIVSGLLKEKLLPPFPHTIKWSSWMNNGVALLLSRTHFPLPEEGVEILSRALQADPISTLDLICTRVPPEPQSQSTRRSDDPFAELVTGNIKRVLSRFHGRALLDILLQLIRRTFCDPTIPTIHKFFNDHPIGETWAAVPMTNGPSTTTTFCVLPDGCLKSVLDLLMGDISKLFSTPCRDPATWIREACSIVFTFKPHWTPEQRGIVESWMHGRPSLDWCFILTFTLENSTASLTLAQMIGDAFPGPTANGHLSIAGEVSAMLEHPSSILTFFS